MTDLLLQIESVADMDLERAAGVGRAFDEDPELRPLRVGGDPARIRVESTLEDLIRATTLPIRWLTVRTNSRRDGYEGGELSLYPGRGGFWGRQADDGSWQRWLVPHEVEAGFLRSWTDAGPDRLDRVAALFGRLCDAIDACYGIATVLPRTRMIPPIEFGLVDVGWLNFFGPALVERWPRLAETGVPTTRLRNGGVVVRIAPTPWSLDAAAKRPVVDAVGAAAFIPAGSHPERGVLAPSYTDHMRFSTGSLEMPWVGWEAGRATATAKRSRARRYAAARRRREAASAGRADLPPVARDAEWSTNFDADDWRSFGRRLFRRLGGELAGQIGKALLEEMASAPLDLEESIVLASDVGPIEVRWFIDDVDSVAIFFFGPVRLGQLIDDEHERWSEG